MLQKATPITEREAGGRRPSRDRCDQHDVADLHRMVPGLALKHRKPRELSETDRATPLPVTAHPSPTTSAARPRAKARTDHSRAMCSSTALPVIEIDAR